MSDPRYRTARWRKARAAVIRRDGAVCSVLGCTTDMTDYRAVAVDHVVEVKDGGAFWDLNNLQVLCTYHNRQKGTVAQARREQSIEPRSPNA